MSANMTFDDLKAVMSRCTGDVDELNPDNLDAAFTDIGYDSLAVLEIASQIQREYSLQIPDEAIEGMNSPQAVIDYVNASLAAV
ncbi:acyl carrier protein [Streptomyces turgidiscabies]|uniref:Putative acyl carrier protein n=2 Tax=Streptomyces turgidiscabies TaxID=85558 RepID=L7FGU8_STRT8|nr:MULTISPECIES: acyl carrier protein [Streptomyces]ELP70419.1 putative acyl carrier protein [Streptomyces turgidiscabies Car8]MDX3494376.1 acyl carrier protein [Streptomyces turgidiscabies]BAP59887.1 putative polyketide synthase acyl carrier protein subunit [Streptomyces turgidiscabies]GAQ74655.1 actinorhodin polyketide synthase acyl carrier [Streptomyces turgidiscabies]